MEVVTRDAFVVGERGHHELRRVGGVAQIGVEHAGREPSNEPRKLWMQRASLAGRQGDQGALQHIVVNDESDVAQTLTALKCRGNRKSAANAANTFDSLGIGSMALDRQYSFVRFEVAIRGEDADVAARRDCAQEKVGIRALHASTATSIEERCCKLMVFGL